MSARETTCSKCRVTLAVVSTSRDGVPYCVVCWQVYANTLTEVIPTIAIQIADLNGPCIHTDLLSALDELETMDDFYNVLEPFMPYIQGTLISRFGLAMSRKPLTIIPLNGSRITITFADMTRGALAIMPEFDGY